jgi:CRP-like cAMP-binding protein
MQKNVKNIACDHCECLSQGIFCNIKTQTLDDISSAKVMNFYKKGQTLYFQGNPAFGLYCINSGKIKISKVGSDGREIIIGIAGPADVLGHLNLYSNENYTSTATVIEDAHICFLDKKFLLNKISEDPVIAVNLIKKLSTELVNFENRNAGLSHKNVRERLAELLLLLKGNYGIAEKGRFRLDIRLSREEMASMVGTANETVIRFISEFKEEGILEQEGKVIYILDEVKLKQTANMAM